MSIEKTEARIIEIKALIKENEQRQLNYSFLFIGIIVISYFIFWGINGVPPIIDDGKPYITFKF